MTLNKPVAYVLWIDSEADNTWTPVKEVIAEKLDLTHSVGILVDDNESFILLAISYDPATRSINNHIKIPKVAIKEMKIIKEAPPRPKRQAISK